MKVHASLQIDVDCKRFLNKYTVHLKLFHTIYIKKALKKKISTQKIRFIFTLLEKRKNKYLLNQKFVRKEI